MPASTGRTVSRVLKGGPSKLRGVIWHKSNGKWEARIYEAGKQRFLGYFTSEVSAAKAYDARAVWLHGAAAKVNFPEDHYETRNNPPAVKPTYVLAVSTPAKVEDIPHTRAHKRKDLNRDEDYVLPTYGRSRKVSLKHNSRAPSNRRSIHDKPISEEGSDSEESLEKGAVEVLANLLSNSDYDGSWRSSAGSIVRWPILGDAGLSRASSPPTASTGASPAVAPKQGPWTPPLFVQQATQPGSTESKLPRLQSLHAHAEAKLQSHGGNEDFADSNFPGELDDALNGNESSSDNEQISANLPLPEHAATPGTEQGPAVKSRHLESLQADRCESNFYGTEWLQANSEVLSQSMHSQDKAPSSIINSLAAVSRPVLATAHSTAASKLPARLEEIMPDRGHEGSARMPANGRVIVSSATRGTRGSSRFRGVSWCEKGQKWRALLWDGNRQHFLGHFKSEEEGARAYDRALLTRKKKDGCLNFPLSDYSEFADQHQHSLYPSGKRRNKLVSGMTEAGFRNTVRTLDRTLAVERQSLQYKQEVSWQVKDGNNHLEYSQGFPRNKGMPGSVGHSQMQIAQDGLAWCPVEQKWKAQLQWGSTVFQLGDFDDKQAAAEAYTQAVSLRCASGREEGTCLPGNRATQTLREPFEGIRWNMGVWEVAMAEQGQCHYLGDFATKATAVRAYTEAISNRSSKPVTNGDDDKGRMMTAAMDCAAVISQGWGQKRRRGSSP